MEEAQDGEIEGPPHAEARLKVQDFVLERDTL